MLFRHFWLCRRKKRLYLLLCTLYLIVIWINPIISSKGRKSSLKLIYSHFGLNRKYSGIMICMEKKTVGIHMAINKTILLIKGTFIGNAWWEVENARAIHIAIKYLSTTNEHQALANDHFRKHQNPIFVLSIRIYSRYFSPLWNN